MFNKSKEIPRSYEIHTVGGGIIFKMYKPTEIQKMLAERTNKRCKNWLSADRVGVLASEIEWSTPKPTPRKDPYKEYDFYTY